MFLKATIIWRWETTVTRKQLFHSYLVFPWLPPRAPFSRGCPITALETHRNTKWGVSRSSFNFWDIWDSLYKLQHVLTAFSKNKIKVRSTVLPESTLLTHPLGFTRCRSTAKHKVSDENYCLREKHIWSDINSPKTKGKAEGKKRLQRTSSYDKNFHGISTQRKQLESSHTGSEDQERKYTRYYLWTKVCLFSDASFFNLHISMPSSSSIMIKGKEQLSFSSLHHTLVSILLL